MAPIHRLAVALPSLCVALLLPATAQAFEYVEVGVGFLGQVGATFYDKPDDQLANINGNFVEADPEYPGFAGLSGGFGGMIDVRFMGYVGIEFDVIHQWDSGSAELKLTDLGSGQSTKFDVNLSNTALHMPLLLKGTIPGEVVTPMLFVGPEFVVPVGDPEASIENQTGDGPTIVTEYAAVADSYVNVMFGLGMEFNLPIPSEDVSVRIPLSLRGSINPGTSSKRSELANETYNASGGLTRVEYKTEWQYQAVVNLGASVHF